MDEVLFSIFREVNSVSPATREKVSVLAFEVANTIVKGYNLMQSLSHENIRFLKREILHSKGVQLLVSTDTKELLRIAAADMREELEIFSREVARFGNMCIDVQWHNLDRYFKRMDLDTKQYIIRKTAKVTMPKLVSLAQHTLELYHEQNSLDRYEQHYQRTLEEVESMHLPRKGKPVISVIQSEINHQKKLVRNLQKKSLWPRTLGEVVEKLVDVVFCIHKAFAEAFEENAVIVTKNDKTDKIPERLGVSGLALYYANIITQIDNIASCPTTLHPNMRDTLYNSLPASVKAQLRSCLQALDSKEGMMMSEIKVEMDKTLHWLVPVATNTTKAHQSFGWFGEWANTGFVLGKTAGSENIIRLQTLDHADKHKMDHCLLALIILLHRLINIAGHRYKYTPELSTSMVYTISPEEEKNLLEEVAKQGPMVCGLASKSQEFVVAKRRPVVRGRSKSEEFMMAKRK